MPLTAADLKFFAAVGATDAADGGGRRSATLVQNGLDNNLFPDVTSADRVSGQTRLRKLYPSLTNTDSAALLGGALAMDSVPADANTTLVAFSTGTAATTRAQAAAALQAGTVFLPTALGVANSGGGVPFGVATLPVTFTTGGTTISFQNSSGTVVSGSYLIVAPPAVGTEVAVIVAGVQYLRRVTARTEQTDSGGGTWTGTNSITVDSALPPFVSGRSSVTLPEDLTSTVRCFGVATVSAALASTDTTLTLVSALAPVVPYVSGAYPTVDRGIAPAPFAARNGKVTIVRNEDNITIWDEQATAAATATVSTVSVGRTDLDQLAVVGANGIEIARFLKDGPTPTPTSGAMTANLAAGTVTFSSVTGFSQPVTIRHRITHRAVVTAASGALLTFSPELTRAFPSGCKVSSHLPFGDVQARVYNVFAQQSWTRVFSDTLIGNPSTLPYSGTPATTNQGAETDRWAIVFLTGNTFACYSEALGLIASGNTASNFAPINPATGAPFFTLLAASWASTILVGSVLRFNTDAAAPPVWVLRCTAPGAGSGNATAALRLLGST